jgi:transposase-like protein
MILHARSDLGGLPSLPSRVKPGQGTPQTLHEWVKKAEIDSGKRFGVPSNVSDQLKALERENRELRRSILSPSWLTSS